MNYIKYFLILFTVACPVYALKTIYIPAQLQTQKATPIARKLHIKLPLQQTDTDWVFTNLHDLLAGTLELRIIRNKKIVEDIFIFHQGKLAEEWKAMVPPVPTQPSALYFGFVSTKAYLTAPGDRLELRLHVVRPVKGIGPYNSGILTKGLYVSSGSYSGLIDRFDISQSNLYKMLSQNNLGEDDRRLLMQQLFQIYNKTAFLNAWSNQWELAITTDSGWLDEYSQPDNM